MGLRKAIVPLLGLVLLTGCFSYEPVEVQEVTFVEVLNVNSDSISVEVTVKVNNPNNYRIILTDPDVDLYVNESLIGKAVFKRDLALEKKTDREYVIPVAAAFSGKFNSVMLASLGGLLGGKMTVGAKGVITGKAGIINRKVPFEFEQELTDQ